MSFSTGTSAWKLLNGVTVEILNEDQLRDVVRFVYTSVGFSTTKSGGISSALGLNEALSALSDRIL